MAECTYSNVYVIDDDQEFAESLTSLLEVDGFIARAFPRGEEFLDSLESLSPGSVMLDIKMPGLDGMMVLDRLKALSIDWPVVMMTGHGDIPLAVQCIHRGAIEFIEKPFSEEKLLAALKEAMNLLKIRSSASEDVRASDQRYASLSKREREVLAQLSTGRTNKQIAMELELSVRTVEMHRANLIRRLGVRTTPEAIRIALENEPNLK